MRGMRPALLLAALCACSHASNVKLTPKSAWSVQADGVEVALENLQTIPGETKKFGARLRLKNRSERTIRVHPQKIELVEIIAPYEAEFVPGEAKKLRSQIKVPAARMLIGGAISGGMLGSNLFKGSLGKGMGGGLGAVLGFAVVAVALAATFAPIGVAALIERATMGDATEIAPGEEGRFNVLLPEVALSRDKLHALRLNDGVEQEMAPLPLTDPTDESLGFQAPTGRSWAIGTRIGGGPILTQSVTAGVGSVGFYAGPQWGTVALVGFSEVLGLGAIGLEARYHMRLSEHASMVPFASYGYYWGAGGLGLHVGHGPRLGLELTFPLSRKQALIFDVPDMYLGVFGQLGPVFLFGDEDQNRIGTQFQVGLTIGVF